MAEINDLDPVDANNTTRFPEGMLPSLVNDGARADEGMLARLFRDTSGYLSASGSANTYAITPSRTIAALAAGHSFRFKVNVSNTGASTLNVSGLGAKPVRKGVSQELANGDLIAGQIVEVTYDAANQIFQMLSTPSTATGSGGSDIYARILKVGVVLPWATSTVPTGWLECNGQAVSRSTYAELYAALGTSYGVGDGSTTFNVPDYRGEFIRGWDHGRSVDLDKATRTDRGDGTTGDNIGTKQGAAVQSHQHGVTGVTPATTISPNPHSHTVPNVLSTISPTIVSASGGPVASTSAPTTGSTSLSATTTLSGNVDVTGGNETHPRNVNVMFIILALPAAAAAGGLGVNGVQYYWDTGTADADPGSGKLRFDTATYTSITRLNISKTDAIGNGLANLIAQWGGSTSSPRGYLLITKVGAPQVFIQISISSAVTDAGGYDKFTVAYVASAGAFANGDALSVQFYRTGDAGQSGITVPNISGLIEDTANDDQNDYFIEYDVSVADHRKVKPKNIGYTATSGTRRSIASKLADLLSVKDFGAAGDGTTDDTTAFANAIAACKAQLKKLYIPNGTYLVDSITYTSSSYADQFDIVGESQNLTIIKKRATSAVALLTIGSSVATNFISNISISNLTLDGRNSTTAAAVVCYDLVRASIENVSTMNAAYGLYLLGGISIGVFNCAFSAATRGAMLDSFSSLAGGGYPNLIDFIQCRFVDATEWGAWVNNGMSITFRDCEVANTGTVSSSTGGLYVGPNMGSAISATDSLTVGVNVDMCWFENNRGLAGIHLNSGRNSVANTLFFTAAANVTNDIKISGGQFFILNCDSSHLKTANIVETGAATGNFILAPGMGNISLSDNTLTTLFTSKKIGRGNVGLNIESSTSVGDSAYTILGEDRSVLTSSAFTVARIWTLPAANAVNAGARLYIIDAIGTVTASNTLTIQRAGADTINGATSVTIALAYGGYILESDGSSKWTAYPLSRYGTGIAAFLATPSSANLAAALTDETGSGAAVFATSPTLTTPVISGVMGFGGATSSFPGLKRVGATQWLAARLADDSDYAQLQGRLTTHNGATTGLTAGALAGTTNASIVIYDGTGQAYRVPCII